MIKLEDVSKQYGRKEVNQDITCHIEANTITGLIGRNGAGKTTLLKMIAGFKRPTKGHISVFQENPFNNLTASQNSIFVDEYLALPASLMIEEIVEFSASFYPNFDLKLAHNLLNYFDIPIKSRQPVLSKGQRSTLHFIIGLAARCPLTIFDEPTSGMDSTVRHDVYRALLKDYIRFPRTVILSSHQIQEIEHLLEDVLMLDHGKLVVHASVDELRDYALKISGDALLVQKAVESAEVIYKENLGNNELAVVIKKTDDFQLTNPNLSQELVPIHDLLTYMTKGRKGGIDDVFHK